MTSLPLQSVTTSKGRPRPLTALGRITSPPLQKTGPGPGQGGTSQNDISSTSKGRPRPRRHCAECRTSGGRRRPTKSKPTLSQRTQNCSSAPLRKSTALPSHAPHRSCQLTAQPCLRRRAASTSGGGNTSVPCSTDAPLWTPLCSTRSHRSP